MLCVRVAVKPLFHGAPPVLEDTNPGHAEDHLKLWNFRKLQQIALAQAFRVGKCPRKQGCFDFLWSGANSTCNLDIASTASAS